MYQTLKGNSAVILILKYMQYIVHVEHTHILFGLSHVVVLIGELRTSAATGSPIEAHKSIAKLWRSEWRPHLSYISTTPEYSLNTPLNILQY